MATMALTGSLHLSSCSTVTRSSFLGSALRTDHRSSGRCSNLKPGVCMRASNSNERKTRIQKVIEEDGIVLIPGCYDALSAAIVQNTGFRAGFISGYALSASLLGKPDIGLLTPPEMAMASRSICAAAPLIPIIADAGPTLRVRQLSFLECSFSPTLLRNSSGLSPYPWTLSEYFSRDHST
eukprot:Gb_01888 [translate_table: standard]